MKKTFRDKTLTFFKRLVGILSIVFAVCLVFAMLAAFISPQSFFLFAFFGLFFPVFLFINLFFVVFWLVQKRWKYVSVPTAAILLSFPTLIHYYGFHIGGNSKTAGAKSLKVLSYNVRNFDLYNWNHNKETRALMMKLISDQHPTVACFQEFYSSSDTAFQNIEAIQQRTGMKYFYFEKSYMKKGKMFWGIATFSQFPIVKKGKVQFENKTQNAATWSDLQIDSATIIRVYNVHLQSIKLKEGEYGFIDSLSENKHADLNAGKTMLGKMKIAFQFRAAQADKIAESISQSPYPVLLCGDFNDTPSSYAYYTISKHLNDAFLNSSFGIGSSYVFFLPWFRIDYILYDSHFRVADFKTTHDKYSDHYPVMAEIEMKSP